MKFNKLILFGLLFILSTSLIGQDQLLFLDFGFSDDPYDLSPAIGIINNLERNKPETALLFVDEASAINLDSLTQFSSKLNSYYLKDEDLYPPSFIRKQVGEILTYERFYYKFDETKDIIIYLGQLIVIFDKNISHDKAINVFYLDGNNVLERDKEIKALLNKEHIGMIIEPLRLKELEKQKK